MIHACISSHQDDDRLLQLLEELAKPFNPDQCNQPGCDRRGRNFPDALLRMTPSQPTRAPSGEEVFSGPSIHRQDAVVFLRLLLPLWSEALASGCKWIEVQKNTTKWRNAFKFAEAGKVMVFGPSGAHFGQVHGVAILSGKAETRRPLSEARACFCHVDPSCRDAFLEYLEGGASFDSVQVCRVFDLRQQGWTWDKLSEGLGMPLPKMKLGFPSIGTEAVRARLLDLVKDAPQRVPVRF